VNVDFDVYRIHTKITSKGSTVEAGPFEQVGKRDRLTRRMRWEQLDDDLTYTGDQLDRAVVAEDQIRTVVKTFRDRLGTEIYPGRTEVPKTLIYAKDVHTRTTSCRSSERSLANRTSSARRSHTERERRV
jgi:type I restriction enzyme R subunit